MDPSTKCFAEINDFKYASKVWEQGTYTNEQPDLLCLFFLAISFLLGGWRTTLIAVSNTALTF